MLTSHIWCHSNLNVFRNRCPTLRMQMIACTTKIKEWTYATFGVHQRILTKSTKSTKVNAKIKLVLPWRIKRSTRTMKTKQFTQARCWSYQRVLTRSTKRRKARAKMKLVFTWRIMRIIKKMKIKQFTQARCWAYQSLDEIDQTKDNTCKKGTFAFKELPDNEDVSVDKKQVSSLTDGCAEIYQKEENQCINEMRSDLEDDTRNSNGKVIVGLFCCELV